MLKKILSFAFLCTLIACGPTPPDDEQPPPPPPGEEPPPPPPQHELSELYSEMETFETIAEINENELQIFTEVNLKAQEILNMNNSEQQNLNVEALLAHTEMDLERFHEIQTVINQEPDLRQDFQQLIREERMSAQ